MTVTEIVGRGKNKEVIGQSQENNRFLIDLVDVQLLSSESTNIIICLMASAFIFFQNSLFSI